MKAAFFRWCAIGLATGLLTVAARADVFAKTPTQPWIAKTVVRGTNLVVTVGVPTGWQSVALDSRKTPRQGAWVPRAVLRGKPLAAKVKFQMPLSYERHEWRVRGERKSAYPLSFYAGKRAFPRRRSSFWRSDLGIGSVYSLRGDGNVMAGTDVPAVPETRQVSEPDIWKRAGDTLYVFNQYRGLQVIDLGDPDAPVLRGELRLPAVGEQLVVLGSGHVALLARDPGAYDRSNLLIVDVSGETPRLSSSLTLEGTVCESRLVGTALYIALQRGIEVDLAGVAEWQYGTAVVSFDLSTPASPVQRSSLWYPGWGTAVMATDRFLFLALQGGEDWLSTKVKVVDIASADGTMSESAEIATKGQVGDKFKMNLSGNVFSVFSEAFDIPPDTDPPSPEETWLTTLETFSLADATNPVPLGLLSLAPGERLYATRFDGNRAYAVTFENIDPLWVLDLSDPAKPVVAGDVEVPGWSTYIHPLGERLVTVGIEDGRVAVSLFDVGDPAKAALRSRVYVSGESSWSEANWDEKAFSVFPDEGLILVPFEGWSNGVYESQVRLIDLGDTALTVRGAIGGNRQIRRTLLHRQRLIALSGKELLSVDIEDRDRPEVKGALELSRTVNRILASGDYLLQLEEASAWTQNGQAVLRVAAKAKPDAILKRVELGSMPVVGACVRGSSLHVLQNLGYATNLLLRVMDLSALPEITTAGKVEVPVKDGGVGDYEAVWPAPDLLVWISRSSGYWMRPMMADIAIGPNPATRPITAVLDMGISRYVWPWWNTEGVHMVALNVVDPAHPEFVSQRRYAPARAWGFSMPFVAQGCVYLSHEQSEQIPITVETGRIVQKWRVGEFLDVIDFADPAHPTARPPISIPGQLAGVSPDGKLVYAVGSRLAYLQDATEETEALYACAYDGVSAYLAGTLPLSTAWPRPVLVDECGRIFLGRASVNRLHPSTLETWTLSTEGVFELEASFACKAPASGLSGFGDLLAVQDTTGRIALFDTTDTTQLIPCGEGEPVGGLWASLNRAWGSLDDGLWIPLDDYGLMSVPVTGE